MKFRNILAVLLIGLLCCGGSLSYARGGGGGGGSRGGGGFSSSKSSSSGWGSKSSSSGSGWGSKSSSSSSSSTSSKSSGGGWGSSSKSSDAPKGWGTTNSRTPDSGLSAKDRNLAAKAKASGTLFNSRSDAEKSFRSNPDIQKKYSSTFSSEPSTRPEYIPKTYQGRDVTYDSSRGGYGYINAMGTWMMYDALTDAMMMNSLMHQNNYVIQTASGELVSTRNSSSSSPASSMLLGLLLGLVIVSVVLGPIFRK